MPDEHQPTYASTKVQSGIFGAVLRFERIMDAEGAYNPDPLTDGLFAVWKHFGKGNIDDGVWDWAMKRGPVPSGL